MKNTDDFVLAGDWEKDVFSMFLDIYYFLIGPIRKKYYTARISYLEKACRRKERR